MFRKISNFLIAIILLFALGILALVGVPLLQGNKLYAVLTESMVPTYKVGSIVVVEMIPAEAIQPQDVITFTMPSFDYMVTHRVVTIDAENRVFYTKGDNNPIADPFPVPFENLEGRVKTSYPYLGTLVSGMRTTSGIILILWIVAIFLILSFLPDFLDKRKEQKQLEEAQDEQEFPVKKKMGKKEAKQQAAQARRTTVYKRASTTQKPAK